jgi:uncharacterized protein YcbK (DUF882 family)
MPTKLSRRQFVSITLALGSVYRLPLAAASGDQSRTLKLHNTHTGESLTTTYHSHNGYQSNALTQLNHLLRDHRQNAVHEIDPALFDQLWDIQSMLGDTQIIEIISGYRTRKTNNGLRAKSQSVAKYSYHTQGRAIDFRLPGVPTWQVRNIAQHLKSGGVGYYEKSDFVHIDTGPYRAW